MLAWTLSCVLPVADSDQWEELSVTKVDASDGDASVKSDA